MNETTPKEINLLAEDATPYSIVGLINHVVKRAYTLKASDIHLDPQEKQIILRFRIDGVMQPMGKLPITQLPEIISRLKVLSGLRTDQHSTNQDGRFRFAVTDKKNLDIRVSIVPTYYGENAVLRLLSSHGTHEELSSLGLNSPQKQLIQDLLQRTHGMTLVTGPTGSGKTTTLYACLNYLKNAQLSIATLEDPIEYAIGHINQVPVNDKTGFTFHRGLRALLRQDPDVIMVGEIRDQETAELATNAALTGHRIFSTLHTNDAISTIPRLMDMGIEPYIITSSLNAVLSQRLTRLLCTKCKQPAPITTSQWVTFCKYLSLPTHTPKTKLFTNAGCTVCNGTGYLGRTGIYEILTLNDALREAIIKRAPIHIIRLLIAKHGMKTMREDGWEKVKQGQISIHELMRVLHD